MKNIYFFLVLSLMAVGCANLPRVSSGKIGCPEEEITIINDETKGLSTRTWTAECRGKRFLCTSIYKSEYNEDVSCAPEVPRRKN